MEDVVVGDEHRAGHSGPRSSVGEAIDTTDALLRVDEQSVEYVSGIGEFGTRLDLRQRQERRLTGQLATLVPAHAICEQIPSGQHESGVFVGVADTSDVAVHRPVESQISDDVATGQRRITDDAHRVHGQQILPAGSPPAGDVPTVGANVSMSSMSPTSRARQDDAVPGCRRR